MFKTKKKIYDKYEPGKDSNFHSDNWGFNARPDLFKSKWFAYYHIITKNPFRIKSYKTNK